MSKCEQIYKDVSVMVTASPRPYEGARESERHANRGIALRTAISMRKDSAML